MTQLVTLQELKTYAKIQLDNIENDNLLNTIINQCSALVENYCGRVFSTADYSEYFNGGVTKVYVNNPPIQYMSGVYVFDGTQYVRAGNPDPTTGLLVNTNYGSAHSPTNNGGEFTSRTKKFGTYACKLTNNAYISGGLTDDFDVNTEDFCIETQVRFSNVTGEQTIFSWGTDANNYAALSVDFSTNGLSFIVKSGNTTVVSLSHGSTSGYEASTWKHVGVSRKDGSFRLFKDGSIIATLSSSNSIPEFSGSWNIGRLITDTNYLTGFVDETRFSWEYRYAASYTAPTISYSSDLNTKLLLHYDGDISDSSRYFNQYTFDVQSGEVNVDTTTGSRELALFSVPVFRNYPNGVKVEYKGGFATIPDDLKNAVMELARLHYRGYPGIKGRSFQSETETKEQLSPDGLPFHVRRVLNLYRIY